jgi:hypothetical protein
VTLTAPATAATDAAPEKRGIAMNNQHAGLSQALAEQHMTQRREQAAHARLLHDARPPRRPRRTWVGRSWRQLARWPSAAADRPVSRPWNTS